MYKEKKMKKLLITVLLLTSLSATFAQDVSKLSNVAQQLSKWANDPQNQNEKILNPQTENNTELTFSILKSIEDKNITYTQKKLDFVNSSQVSENIKQSVINLINQNITYLDYEKVSYGLYSLKLCKLRKPSECYYDNTPDGRGGCLYQYQDACCLN